MASLWHRYGIAKINAFFLQNQPGASTFACKTALFPSFPFQFSFLYLSFFFHVPCVSCFFLFFFAFPFPFRFSILFLSFSFPIFSILFLSFSFAFPFLFLPFLSMSFPFHAEPKSIIAASTLRNQHSRNIILNIQNGVSLFWEGPIANLSFLHFLKTNVQPIHILVLASFDDCSYLYIYIHNYIIYIYIKKKNIQ